MPAPKILVIAYGNPLRCDDGLAWRVAEKLSEQNLPSGVEIITCHQLTPELALPASQASTVLFIDAARAGIPGEIATQPIKPRQLPSIFTHEFSPSTILNVAQGLYGRCPEAFAVSLCGECFDHGETLSQKVKESLPGLLTHVKGLIQAASASLLPL
jgi:hydrogenase maturation protease